MGATLEMDRVSKSFDGVCAVDELSFSIAPGTIFGLLGPNGAGKSSAIRMMIGILAPDSGSVRAFGVPISRSITRRIGYLPEERGLYRTMTVSENLAFIGELAGVSVRDARGRGLEWSRRLGLEGCFDRKVEELSKGMQQKVQLIAALIHDPELVIMDEPFAGLDPVNVNELRDVLTGLRSRGRTLLLSTHRMDQAERLCDEICLIHRGRSVLRGSLREAKESCATRSIRIELDRAAAFLASSPMVETFRDLGNSADITIRSGADSQDLLREAMERARVLRFEVREPSLEDVFITTVGNRNV